MNRIFNGLGKRWKDILLQRPFQRTAATLEKDMLLYKYENTRFFRYLNLFGVSQFVFWTYLSNFATTLRDVPVPIQPAENQKWYEKMTFLGENKYKNGMAVLFFLVGELMRIE